MFTFIASTHDLDTVEKKLIFNTGVNAINLKVRIYDDKLLEGTEAFGVRLIVSDHHRLKLCNPFHVTVFIKDGTFNLAMCIIFHSLADEKPSTHPLNISSRTLPPTTYPTTRRTTRRKTRLSRKTRIQPPHHFLILNLVPVMLVKVAFKVGHYVVQESCTLLSVTLKVFGEVIQPFTIGVRPVGFHEVSAMRKFIIM